MGHPGTKPPSLLRYLWNSQDLYNRRLRLAQEPEHGEYQSDKEKRFWNKQYLLGLVSEVDEVLREIDWKTHRKKPVLYNERNLALELADLTKFVFSLWQNNGFTLTQMLEYSIEKSKMVEAEYEMEFYEPPEGWPIIIADVDGTLADYRLGLIEYLQSEHGIDIPSDPTGSLLFDFDNQLAYSEYYPLKEEFEAVGGYRWLPPYMDVLYWLADIRNLYDYYLVVYTARPISRYKYIWLDTYEWLEEHSVKANQLHMGGEERILAAKRYLDEGRSVVLLEDNPDLIRRASTVAGLRIIARTHPYNESLGSLPNVELVEDFNKLPLKDIFPEVEK